MAKLIALDGIPAQKIVKSGHIREYFACLGMHLPKGHKGVMKLMNNFHAVAKKEMIDELKSFKRKGEKFGTTLDEWTSCANRRYLNVNVHTNCNRVINLGLIRIKMSCPAEELNRLYVEKLKEFDLNEADIIGCTSDGARVMQKFGRNLTCIVLIKNVSIMEFTLPCSM